MLPLCLNHRLRKDVLDDVDTAGLQVQLAWQRITDPKAAQKMQAEKAKREAAKAEKEQEKEEKDKAEEPKKAGSWSGLPL